MNSIEHLRVLVGLSAEDELRISQKRIELGIALADWEPEYTAWLLASVYWPDPKRPPFIETYLKSFVSGVYDQEFYAVQYEQALLWLIHRMDNGNGIAALSRLRQFFIGVSESWGEPELAKSLCRVVDVAQSIQAMVSHLSQTLQRLQKDAEKELRRIRHTCESIVRYRDHGIIDAYSDHFQWKLRAYSLALGENVSPDEVPLNHHECRLGQWLDQGGWAEIPEASRDGLDVAHERMHKLMGMVLGEAHKRRPHYIVQFLADIEAASEEITGILGSCIEGEMMKIAVLDGLTGLGNRRLFEQELERRLALCRREGAGFGLLFMDLDHFKQINDRHGHRIGDEILRLAAQAFKDGLRGSDTVFRWGGEEFAALVHAADGYELQRGAERLRKAVENMDLSGYPLDRLTVSIGGAYPNENCRQDPTQLFSRADDNLNQAKSSGRNRAVVS